MFSAQLALPLYTNNIYKEITMSEPKKMERPRTGRMLAGVCAAIANYANIDVTVVRVAYILLTLFTAFSGIIVYFILMLIIPEEKNQFKIEK